MRTENGAEGVHIEGLYAALFREREDGRWEEVIETGRRPVVLGGARPMADGWHLSGQARVAFENLPAECKVVAVGLFDAKEGGHLFLRAPLAVPHSVFVADDYISIEITDVLLRADVPNADKSEIP